MEAKYHAKWAFCKRRLTRADFVMTSVEEVATYLYLRLAI